MPVLLTDQAGFPATGIPRTEAALSPPGAQLGDRVLADPVSAAGKVGLVLCDLVTLVLPRLRRSTSVPVSALGRLDRPPARAAPPGSEVLGGAPG